MASKLIRRAQPIQLWADRVVIQFLQDDLHIADGMASLDEWLAQDIDGATVPIDVDLDKATAWIADSIAKAEIAKAKAAAKKAAKATAVGSPEAAADDGDFVGFILAGRPLDLGEMDCREGDLDEFKQLLEAEADAGADKPGTSGDDPPGNVDDVKTDNLHADHIGPEDLHRFCLDADFVVDHDLVDEVAAVGCGHGLRDRSSAGGETPGETLPATLLRLNIKNNLGRFPREVISTKSPDGSLGEHPLGKIYLVWGRTYKATCKRHKNCSLMMNLAWCPSPEASQRVVYEWLASGLHCSEHEHFVESKALVRLHKPSAK